MKMLVMMGPQNFLRDFDQEDLETLVSEGTPCLVLEDEEAADYLCETLGLEFQAV